MNNLAKEIPGRETPPKTEGVDFQMQAELMRKSKEAGVKPDEWIDKYAEPFREIITKNPSLAESYRTDKERTLKEVEKLLEESEKNKGA